MRSPGMQCSFHVVDGVISLINKYNFFTAVKRLMREAQELSEPTSEYHAQPVDDNLFEWHFTVRGPAESDFDGGIYHGRIILPPDYPMKPPSIMLLTVFKVLISHSENSFNQFSLTA